MTNKSSCGLMLLIFTIGIISSDLFGYSNPTISSIEPYNPRVGDTVLITGTGFDPSNFLVNKVYFNSSVYVFPSTEYDSIQAEILTVTTNTITAIAPLGAYYGNLSVSVNGLNSSSEIYFSMTPTIERFTPSLGYVGDTITIAGTGFNWVQPVFVRIGFTNGWDTGPISATQTSLRVVVPIGSTTGPIKLSTTTSSFDFAVIPIVNNLSPSSGLVGSEVSIYGLGFDPNETDYQVYFNGVKGEINLINSTIIRAIVPHRASSGNVVVLVEGDTIKGPTLQFEVTPSNVRIYSYSSYSGFIGDSIIINGTGFDQAGPPLTVQFGGISSVINSYNDSIIHTVIPKAALSGPITIGSAGLLENGPYFKVNEKIDLTSIQSVEVGDTVSYWGNGFNYSVKNYYKLNISGESIDLYDISDSTISFIVPYFATSGDPILYSDYDLFVLFELPYLGIKPTINLVSPDTVIAGRNQQITIDGTGFGIRPQSQDHKIIFGGNVEQRDILSNNYSEGVGNKFIQIRAIVPITAKSGYVTLSIDGLEGISPKHLVVLPDTLPYKPEPPSSFRFEAKDTSYFTIHWNRSYRALGFLVDVSKDDFSTIYNDLTGVDLKDTLMTLTGLEAGTKYQMRFRSYSDTDTSEYNIISVTTIPSIPIPSTPLELDANNFILQWVNTKGANGYLLDLSIDRFQTFETIRLFEPGVRLEILNEQLPFFRYRVRAFNFLGESGYSRVMTIFLSENKSTWDVAIYPNPVSDFLSIDNLDQSVEFSILDNAGKYYEATVQEINGTHVLDIHHLKSGTYILRLSSHGKFIHIRFVKL